MRAVSGREQEDGLAFHGTLDTAAAYSYIRTLIGHFNNTYNDPSGPDPFDLNNPVLPGQGNALTGDSTVTPGTSNPSDPKHPYMNYNFALARVRLQGSSGMAGEASDVRVFFRIFTTQTFDTDYINTAGAVSSNDPNADAVLLTRQALHAHRIRFKHPRTGKVFEAEAPLPDEMQRALTALRQHRAV